MQKIMPCLWFDDQAEQAAKFYISIFKDAKIKAVSYYGEGGRGEKGKVMTVIFSLNGEDYMALNGGPEYKFTPAISLYVPCENQAEVDELWEELSQGGEKGPCGWLTDKFGVSWQVVPTILGVLLTDKNEEKAASVMQAMLEMGKLDIAKLQLAYEKG